MTLQVSRRNSGQFYARLTAAAAAVGLPSTAAVAAKEGVIVVVVVVMELVKSSSYSPPCCRCCCCCRLVFLRHSVHAVPSPDVQHHLCALESLRRDIAPTYGHSRSTVMSHSCMQSTGPDSHKPETERRAKRMKSRPARLLSAKLNQSLPC
jgi:hypothetical protein